MLTFYVAKMNDNIKFNKYINLDHWLHSYNYPVEGDIIWVWYDNGKLYNSRKYSIPENLKEIGTVYYVKKCGDFTFSIVESEFVNSKRVRFNI